MAGGPVQVWTAPAGASLPPTQRAAIAAAAERFEAMALGQLLAPMFQTVNLAHGPFGGGAGEEAWTPVLVDTLAKQMAAHGGIGLAQPVMQQMLRMQETQG